MNTSSFTPQDLFKILIPIGIFLLGYMMNDIREKMKERKRLYRLKKYVLMWAELIIKPIEDQITAYQNFIDHIEKCNDEPKVNEKLKIPIDNLFDVDRIDFATFTVFKQQGDISENTILYHKFVTALNKIESIQNNASVIYKTYTDDYLEKVEEFSLKYNQLRNDLQLKLNEKNLSQIFHDLRTAYFEINDTIFNENNMTTGLLNQRLFIRDNYLQPVISLMKNLTQKHNASDLVQYMQSISYLLTIIQYYVNNNNRATEFYKEFLSDLKNAKTEIEDCKRQIKDKELVDWVEM